MPREKAAADIQYPVTNNQSHVTITYGDFGDIPDICASAAVLTGACAGKAGQVKIMGKTASSATLEVLVPNAGTNSQDPLPAGIQVQISFTAVR